MTWQTRSGAPRRSSRAGSSLVTVAAVIGVAVALSACSWFGGKSGSADVARRAGERLAAPMGRAEAELVPGPEQNGVQSLVPVIREAGTDVFRDDVAYSTRHGVAIVWQSDGEALWVFSSDVGTFRVAKGSSGWSKTHSTDVPDDVRAKVGT